jgi:hypothetical protein
VTDAIAVVVLVVLDGYDPQMASGFARARSLG